MKKVLYSLIAIILFGSSVFASETSITIRAEVVQIMGIQIIEPSYEGIKLASLDLGYINMTPEIKTICTGGCNVDVEAFVDNGFDENEVMLANYGIVDEIELTGSIE